MFKKLLAKIKNSKWLKAAGIRAAKTMAQTAIAMITVGAGVDQVKWLQIGSVVFVSGVVSILTSITTKLPELPDELADDTPKGA